MDYIALCKQLYGVTGIPAVLYHDGHVLYASMAELLGTQLEDAWTIYEPTRNPEFTAIDPDLEYGHVRIEGTGYDLFLGPIFTTPVTEKLIQKYFEDAKIPPEHQEEAAELIYGIPINGHAKFVRILLFLHLVLNGKEARVEDFYEERDHGAINRGARLTDLAVEFKENERLRSSYGFERELYHYIEQGDTARLKRFLDTTRVFPAEGKLAHTPLRNAKNTMIGLATKICVLAAIPGGIDAERAYQLVDLYSLECEQTQSLEEVHRLQYIMLMDFCQRCAAAKLPKGVSAEIYRCMTFIQSHTNASIGLEDVAGEIGRSSSYVMRRFKAELGMSVGEYITKCKLEEACDLLIYGDRSLAEISAYLGYSSQSYFQNVFKKQFGMTPLQYRKQNRKAN